MRRAAAIAFLVAAPALAQYPDRPIKFIVPQAAGSATDNVVRLLAPEMAKVLGQQIIVENRPGGALTIGIEATAKAPPDGYTIGMGPVGAMAITRHMVAKLPYDIERDLQPIALSCALMFLAVRLVDLEGRVYDLLPIWRLVLDVGAGVAVYAAAIAIFDRDRIGRDAVALGNLLRRRAA